MVIATSSRAAVESTATNGSIPPQDLLQALQQIEAGLGNIAQDMQTANAQHYNIRIIGRNSRGITPLQFCPLQKNIPGYGRDTALPLLNLLNAVGLQNFHQQFPPGGNAHQIGSIPLPFNARLESYTHLDIHGMVVFYNDTFGIEPKDDLAERLIKFRRFLTEF